MAARSIFGSKKGIYFRIAALTYLVTFCVQYPKFPVHFHKEGVVHSIYLESQNSNSKIKYFPASFFVIAGLVIFNPLTLDLRSSQLIKAIEYPDLSEIYHYFYEHRCRDDLLSVSYKIILSGKINCNYLNPDLKPDA